MKKVFLLLFVVMFSFSIQNQQSNKTKSLIEREPRPKLSKYDRHSILWLARGIRSETDKRNEMEPIGWVIRNRVELVWNGNFTYQLVVLDPRQFSAFNSHKLRRRYEALNYDTNDSLWQYALKTAYKIYFAHEQTTPIITTNPTHFY